MKNRTYSILNNRYERYLNELRDRAWNCMSKPDWNVTLYEFGRVQFGKSATPADDEESVYESVDDEPVNEPVVDEHVTNEHIVDEHVVNESPVDIEYTTKRDLYNYYRIYFKTIPDGYDIKMRYNRINGKRGRLYKLVKK